MLSSTGTSCCASCRRGSAHSRSRSRSRSTRSPRLRPLLAIRSTCCGSAASGVRSRSCVPPYPRCCTGEWTTVWPWPKCSRYAVSGHRNLTSTVGRSAGCFFFLAGSSSSEQRSPARGRCSSSASSVSLLLVYAALGGPGLGSGRFHGHEQPGSWLPPCSSPVASSR